MPSEILVVEYEPRYVERLRQALGGGEYEVLIARDGEEALKTLESRTPGLIVLSSVIPRIGTPELIRMIRARGLQKTPILVTVSGYNGKSSRSDATRMGATDILAKPYSDGDITAKIGQLLGEAARTLADGWPNGIESEHKASESKSQPLTPMTDENNSGLTSNELFGDLIDDDKSPAAESGKKAKRDDTALDKMLAETLSGVRIAPPKRRDSETLKVPAVKPPDPPADATVQMSQPVPPKAPVEATVQMSQPVAPKPPMEATVQMSQPVAPKPVDAPRPAPIPKTVVDVPKSAEARSASMSSDLDKLLENTLSGIDKRERPSRPRAAEPPPPKVEIPPPPAVSGRRPAAAPPKAEKVTASSPILAPPPPVSAIPVEDEPAGIKFGQYVLQDKIATGGMAEVWKARMRGVEGFQKIVAIKKILPHLSDNQEFVTMFVDEAKLAAQLNHNNIIHIYDLGKISSSYFIAMEYIDGYDLKTILSRGEECGQPVPMEIALFIASKIAAALDYAHRKRDFNEKNLELVHRDVSPQNVLISQEGDIKLCDFGIAKAASKASHTQAGALKGKLQYMSPEQAWGRKIDRRSDIFALGAVLFEMLCGRKLFQGDNELSILEQVREARVTPPSKIDDELPAEVDAIVLKALQKESDQRYQTAGDMARDLDAILYSFKPTPTSADLAIYMHRIWSDEPVTIMASMPFQHEEEQVEDNVIAIKPVAVPHVAPPPPVPVATVHAPAPAAISTPAFGIAHDEEKKKLPIVPIAIGVAVVAALAVGGFLMTRGDKSGTATTPVTTTAGGAAGTTTGTDTMATDTLGLTSTADVQTTTAVGSALATDPAKVEEEVRKRLDAERLKLEQQRAQQALAQKTPTAAVATPEPVVPAPVQRQPDPEPAVVAPPPPPPAPVVREEPQVAKVREGELVQPGTEGLAPPEVIKQFKPPYPPMAKAQRVEGIVIVQALISETGQVLETKVLRGSPMLNDAALEAVKRSTFRPATKDGVKVKSFKTMTIPFKL